MIWLDMAHEIRTEPDLMIYCLTVGSMLLPHHICINSSPPSAAYMRQWTGSPSIQVLAWRLFLRGIKTCLFNWHIIAYWYILLGHGLTFTVCSLYFGAVLWSLQIIDYIVVRMSYSFVFVCWIITLTHCHHYSYVFESIEPLNGLSGTFCWVYV